MYFKDVVGQRHIKQRLVRSVQAGFIPHAQLLYGNEGVGLLPLALAYARYLNCTDRGQDDACGVCSSCVKYNKYAHPDLHFVFPIVKLKKNTDRGKDTVCDDYINQWREFLLTHTYFNLPAWLEFIGADNAQGMIYTAESDEIIKKLNLKTYEAEYKVMIIWLPEKMHVDCANKLLKILEEPYDKTIFLLVSENPENVIGTIQSRAQNLHIPPIETEDLSEVLSKQYDWSPDVLASVVHLANGSYTKAMEVIDSSADRELFLDLFITIMRNCWTRDVKNMKNRAEYFASLGRERQKMFLSYAQRMIRENFVYDVDIQDINYLNNDEAAFSSKFTPYVNERNVMEMMNELELAEKQIEQNVNPRMIFFDLSMKIAVLLKK